MNTAVAPYDAQWAALPVFFQKALTPIRQFLAERDVVEISINAPGGIWIERLGANRMIYHEAPELRADDIRFLAQQVASDTRQVVNAEKPLLSAALPMGERFQCVLAPAGPRGGAISIRKQVIQRLSLKELAASGALSHVRVTIADELTNAERRLCELLRDASGAASAETAASLIQEALELAVRERVSILVSGGTSTGKTTFLNSLLHAVPRDERLISIEDTRELDPPHANYVPLLASKGEQGMANVTIQDLLEAALRMRPDRLFVGEVRGAEAFSFLQAINTGHPGSMSTVHANSPSQAYTRLALATMQAGLGLSKDEVVEYIRSVIPLVVQLSRIDGRRVVSEVQFTKLQGENRRD